MEISNVIAKIRALAAKTETNGCSEHEAMAAAGKVGELLQAYNLSLDQVFLDSQTCVKLVIPTGRKQRHPIAGCLISLAKFCDCKVWFNTKYVFVNHIGSYQKEWIFFGLETDTVMAKYLYHLIYAAMDNEALKFKDTSAYKNCYTSRKSAYISFLEGMSNRIHHRLSNMTRERHQKESEQTIVAGAGVCTDIVLIKHNKVEDEFRKLGLNLTSKTSYSKSRHNSDAYSSGQAAGDRVSLNRPIGSGRTAGYLS